MEAMLKVEKLRKQFRLSAKQQRLEGIKAKTLTAVDELSFFAYKGEIFGLLGPNGAGKTTTLRMLATLISPDGGDAWVDGTSIRENPQGVREKIGFLTGELKLEEFFTPNYLFDFFAQLHRVPPEEARQRKAALFEAFGVGEFAEVKVGHLSTGMRQKLSLIISVVHDPALIIFDEPTNGLDVLTARLVTDFLLELRARGKTVILSTHIFSLVEKVCDRVGVIIGGRMVACDKLAALTAEESMEDRFFGLYQTWDREREERRQ